MSFNLAQFQIPFNSVGYTATIDFSQYGQYTNLPFNAGNRPSWQSGATLRLNNISDSLLSVIFPRSGIATTLSPGANQVVDIPKGELNCQITVTGCNPFQLYPLEIMSPTFYTQQDNVRASQGGYVTNPNVPAQAVSPGTFGAGVLVPANQLIPGALQSGGWQFDIPVGNSMIITLE